MNSGEIHHFWKGIDNHRQEFWAALSVVAVFRIQLPPSGLTKILILNPVKICLEQENVRRVSRTDFHTIMVFPKVEITLPGWVDEFFAGGDQAYPAIEDRMGLVIDLAKKNVEEKTGGPFGAGIFETDSGRLIAPGVNRVENLDCSVLHAEIVAIMVAQKKLGRYDLGDASLPAMELVTSVEPCAMCLGAVVWCGVHRLLCGARDSDARAIGFDEGPKAENWIGELENRGIAVVQDLSRKRAVDILNAYLNHGGLIYNPRRTR